MHKPSHTSFLKWWGILHGKKAFTPPEFVQISLINKCDLNCIVCPFHSDFLKQQIPYEWKEMKQDPRRLTNLIHELSDFGVKTIIFNAQGEPFLYPSFMKFVKLVKKKNMGCYIITNGTLINNSIIKLLSKLNVDLLKISLWAGDAETYIKVHPNQTKKTFYKIRQGLLFLKKLKEYHGHVYPRISIINVILNENYNNIPQMLNFAQETGVDYVNFRIAGHCSDKLKKFRLSKKQKDSTISLLQRLQKHKFAIQTNLKEFKKVVSYDWGDLQRMDRNIPSKIPCYVGWHFSRIEANGHVTPCATFYNKSMGNIHEQSFRDIWFSSEYNHFRKLAKQKSKGTYFKDGSCNTHCCHYLENLFIYRKLNPFRCLFSH